MYAKFLVRRGRVFSGVLISAVLSSFVAVGTTAPAHADLLP